MTIKKSEKKREVVKVEGSNAKAVIRVLVRDNAFTCTGSTCVAISIDCAYKIEPNPVPTCYGVGRFGLQ